MIWLGILEFVQRHGTKPDECNILLLGPCHGNLFSDNIISMDKYVTEGLLLEATEMRMFRLIMCATLRNGEMNDESVRDLGVGHIT